VLLRWLVLTLLVPGLLACSYAPSSSPVVRFTGADGRMHDVKVELVASPAERARGLMERPSMPEDAGMLFVFPTDTDGAFWMKDTLIPLSIAFIAADGTVVALDDMQPQSTDLHQPGARYRYALEVNQGYFARAGIRVGDKVQLPALPTVT
jgi:uncharacterized membrane protein (UPF0127 family)